MNRHLLCTPGRTGPVLVTLDEDGEPEPVGGIDPSNARRPAETLGALWEAPAPEPEEPTS